jgi:hypothetical protein
MFSFHASLFSILGWVRLARKGRETKGNNTEDAGRHFIASRWPLAGSIVEETSHTGQTTT